MALDSRLSLRQHLNDGNQRVFGIVLSHSPHTFIYGIYADARCSNQDDELDVRQWGETRSDCAALLSTQQGCVFMESLSLPTFVQSFKIGPGGETQEWMLLKSSDTLGERIQIQLRPFELLRLGPFHLTYVPAKDVFAPPISNFYRVASAIEIPDRRQATEPSRSKAQPQEPEMPLGPTPRSTTAFEYPFGDLLDQGQVYACQDPAGSSSVSNEPMQEILERNPVTDASINAQSDKALITPVAAPEVSRHDEAVETADQSGGKLCQEIDTQDSMLPSIHIKTPAPSLGDARDTARGAGASCGREVSYSPPKSSPTSERKRKRSISPSSTPQSPAIRLHSSSHKAAHGQMHECRVSEMAQLPPEASAVSKPKKKRSVSPSSTRQSAIERVRSDSYEASDEGVPKHKETKLVRSPLQTSPPKERRKKRRVTRFSVPETPIKSMRPRELMAYDDTRGEPPSELQTKRSPPSTSVPKSPVTSTRSSDVKVSDKPTGRQTLRVLFASSSTIDESSTHIKFLREQHVQIVKDIRKCTILCIGAGGFKKTSKFINAVLLGLPITTDEWVLQSVQAGELLAVEDFPAKDPVREAEWKFDLAESVSRAEEGHKVFENWTINFSPAAKKSAGKTAFDELKSLALAAGAQSVSATDPKKLAAHGNIASHLLIIAANRDPIVSQLGNMKCFSQEIVGMSILRGVLDTSSDEFLQK